MFILPTFGGLGTCQSNNYFTLFVYLMQNGSTNEFLIKITLVLTWVSICIQLKGFESRNVSKDVREVGR